RLTVSGRLVGRSSDSSSLSTRSGYRLPRSSRVAINRAERKRRTAAVRSRLAVAPKFDTRKSANQTDGSSLIDGKELNENFVLSDPMANSLIDRSDRPIMLKLIATRRNCAKVRSLSRLNHLAASTSIVRDITTTAKLPRLSITNRPPTRIQEHLKTNAAEI